MGDGTSNNYAGIAGLDLHELARAAVQQYISKLGRVRNVSVPVPAAEENQLTAHAWLISNDLVGNTQRGQQRARRQRGAGYEPGRVLTASGLARTLENELRNDRERAVRQAAIIRRRAKEVAAATSGEAALLRAAWEDADPMLWLIAAQECAAQQERQQERAEWTPEPAQALRRRRMPGVLHLRRGAEGDAP